MSTIEEKTNEDFLKFFKGGKQGVQQRFGDLIKKGLVRLSYPHVVKICEDYCLDLEVPKKY